MTPNDEQLLAIKQYLTKHLKYRETKDEMFDHILTALEYVPEGISFGEAMNGVIGEIGGLKGIARIEKVAKISAVKILLKRYLETFKQVCKSPLILVIAILTLIGYYLIERFFSSFGLIIFMMLMMNIPNFSLKRSVLKKSNWVNVKNDAFRIVYQVFGMLVPGMMFLLLVAMQYGSRDFFLAIAPYITSITFCITLLHASVLYRLTREEFRVKITEI